MCHIPLVHFTLHDFTFSRYESAKEINDVFSVFPCQVIVPSLNLNATPTLDRVLQIWVGRKKKRI